MVQDFSIHNQFSTGLVYEENKLEMGDRKKIFIFRITMYRKQKY